MNVQEIIFWSIFLVVASLLIVGQLLVTPNTKNVFPPSQVAESLPDVSKTDKDATKIYENNTYAEKLSELSNRKLIYGLGEYSGPSFDENRVKDGALQISYQNIIRELEEKKKMFSKLISESNKEALIDRVEKIFSILYQFLSDDPSLAIIYRIWKKEKNQVVTYYILTIFDDDYALAILKSVASDILLELSNADVDVEFIWSKLFKEK